MLNIGIVTVILLTTRVIENWRSTIQIDRIGLTVILCTIIVGVAALTQLGRIYFAPKLLATPEKVDLGVLRLGSSVEAAVPLQNITGRVVHIWGAKSSCSCATVSGLPAEIPKGERINVKVLLKPTSLRDVKVKIIFFTDSHFSNATVTVTANVVDADS
ncbi:MAG: DUF1573 domain-containing protein [Planctomycetota bacterium]